MQKELNFTIKALKELPFAEKGKRYSVKGTKEDGLILRIHDIRRTFGSYQAITGSSLQIIGKSLGHKHMDSTQIYARLHTDPVRHSMETAVGEMKRLANVKVVEVEDE